MNRLLALLCVLALPALAYEKAAEPAPTDSADAAGELLHGLDLEAFRRIPVLNNGRKMPMDSFARQKLLQISGRSRVGKEPAYAWLARTLFAPETVREDAIFLINDPETAQALGIETDERERHSAASIEASWIKFDELSRKASEMEEKDRTRVDSELLRLYVNLNEFFELTHSVRFGIPGHPFIIESPELRASLGLPADQTEFSYLDLHRRGALLHPHIEGLAAKPQAEWSEVEQEAFRVSRALFEWSRRYQGLRFAMIPSSAHGEEHWLSAWDCISIQLRDQAVSNAIVMLQDMAQAYRRGDQETFDRTCRDFALFVNSRLPGDRDLRWTSLEVVFNKLNLFFWSKVLYTFAFLAALGALFSRPDFTRPNALSRGFLAAAASLTLLAFIPHTAGIVLRMIIMGRPPVTNLYATFLFVAWVGVVIGLIVEAFQRRSLGVLTASFCGISLMLIANYFSSEGDTMGKVVAVLSSNFWLTTHVLTITMGYAGCVLAGLVGHVYLLSCCFAPRKAELLGSLKRALFGVLGFGLIFSFLGTMLGGVWADQSWGRFWGWDPKENGALLIVLWCSVLFHAKLARMIGDVGMAAGAAFGIIIVMIAWLGVNLLGVGLHSYGFISGLAFGLILYIVIQLAILANLTPIAQRRLAECSEPPPR